MADSLTHNLTATTAPTPGSFLYLDTGSLDRKVTLDDLFATMYGAYNAKNYGVIGDGSTDDTSAIQTFFLTCVTAGKAAYFPGSQYLMSTVAGTNAQVNFPYIGTGALSSTTEQKTLRIIGALPPPTSGESTVLPTTGYTVFKSTVTSGTHTSIFASANTGAGRNNLHVVMENVIVQAPANPKYHALNFDYQQDVDVQRVLVHAGSLSLNGITQPTNVSVTGVAFPLVNNSGGGVGAEHVIVWGFYTAYQLGELLLSGSSLAAVGCMRAIETTTNNHPNIIQSLVAVECNKVFVNSGSTTNYLKVELVTIENANGQYQSWMNKDGTAGHVDDSSNGIHGSVTWHVVDSSAIPPVVHVFTKLGGTAFVSTEMSS